MPGEIFGIVEIDAGAGIRKKGGRSYDIVMLM